MARCNKCGLLEIVGEVLYCHRFKKELSEEEFASREDCSYFCQVIHEGEEPLTPKQHLIMQDNELKRKKMRGPL